MDEQGVAFRLYAAERLLEAKRDQKAVLELFTETVKGGAGSPFPKST